MSHITDYKRDSMQTVLGSSVENIDDLEIAYLQGAGATSNQVNNAWMEVFLANGATSGNWNDAAEEFLDALGATGTGLPAKWYWFWVTNGGVIASSSLLTDLVSWWSLDETSGTRVDSHGSNDLTDNNTVGYSASGKVSNAADFVALNTEYLSANTSTLQGGNTDYTVAAWVKADSTTDGRTIASSGQYAAPNTPSTQNWLFGYIASTKLLFYVSNGSTWSSVQADTFGAISTGTWYYVIASHNATTSEISISINNGTPDTATPNTPSVQTTEFGIGRYGPNDSEKWDGLIDEFAFWSRLLTDDEKTELYNSGSGIGYPG